MELSSFKILESANTNERFFWSVSTEKPILDILLVIDKRCEEKLLLKLKKVKNRVTIIIKYTIKWRSS